MAALLPLLVSGREISGADGLFPTDQLQYLTWIREASNHLLIGNRFDLLPDSRVFLHPGFLFSGLIHRFLGLSLQASFLVVWKPVAVLIAFGGCLLYVRRLLPAVWPRRVALVIALFAVMPWGAVAKVTGWGGPPRHYTLEFISGEMWTGQTLFGYMMTATAVFLLPLVLLCFEKARSSDSWRLAVSAALGAIWVMWVQPWQGAELILIIVGVEAWQWSRGRGRPSAKAAFVVAAASLPAIYYAAIASVDPAWELAGKANAAGAQPLWAWPWWSVVLTLGPLSVPAIAAFRKSDCDWQQLAVRIWPLTVAVVYFQPFGTFPYHALQGLTLPLAILAVEGFTSARPRWLPRPSRGWVVAALFLLIVPGTVDKVNLIRESIHTVAFPYYVFDGEARALEYLEANGVPGGVLSDNYASMLVAPYAGRETYLGPFSWTPDWPAKTQLAGRFFTGKMDPAESQRFVTSSGTRFVFQQCGGRVEPPRSLAAQLGPLVESTHDFGCARVYVLRPTTLSERVSAAVGAPVRH